MAGGGHLALAVDVAHGPDGPHIVARRVPAASGQGLRRDRRGWGGRRCGLRGSGIVARRVPEGDGGVGREDRDQGVGPSHGWGWGAG